MREWFPGWHQVRNDSGLDSATFHVELDEMKSSRATNRVRELSDVSGTISGPITRASDVTK
jgi:hypothetical protein